jgi:hypothetical protein
MRKVSLIQVLESTLKHSGDIMWPLPPSKREVSRTRSSACPGGRPDAWRHVGYSENNEAMQRLDGFALQQDDRRQIRHVPDCGHQGLPGKLADVENRRGMMGISARVMRMRPIMVVMRLGMQDARGEAERSEEKQRAVGRSQAERAELSPGRPPLFVTSSKEREGHGYDFTTLSAPQKPLERCVLCSWSSIQPRPHPHNGPSVCLIAIWVLHDVVYLIRFGSIIQIRHITPISSELHVSSSCLNMPMYSYTRMD